MSNLKLMALVSQFATDSGKLDRAMNDAKYEVTQFQRTRNLP